MDTQQAFETAVKHLRKQGCRSQQRETISITCMYRLPENNLKCAVGALIPDEIYRESMEGIGIAGLLADFPKLKGLFKNVDIDMLEDLQRIHDKCEVEEWEEEFKEVATNFGLTMPSKGE